MVSLSWLSASEIEEIISNLGLEHKISKKIKTCSYSLKTPEEQTVYMYVAKFVHSQGIICNNFQSLHYKLFVEFDIENIWEFIQIFNHYESTALLNGWEIPIGFYKLKQKLNDFYIIWK